MFLSLIVPCYNIESFVCECVDSILCQSSHDFELILVDDGSTDATGPILDDYSRADSRVRVVHKVNGGLSSARNAGLDVSKGKWIWFVDGDDAIHPNAIQFLIDAFKRFPEAESLMYRQYYDQEKIPETWEVLPDVSALRIATKRNSESYYYARCTAWTTIYRRELIGDFRFEPHFRYYEDTPFTVPYWWRTRCWIIAEAKLYFYRQRGGSLSRQRPNLLQVQNWLEAEHRLADNLAAHRDEWTREDMSRFFKWNENVVWYTHRFMFFRLPLHEMKTCLGQWLFLQNKQFSLSGRSRLDRKMIVSLLGFVPSAMLCSVLIFSLRTLGALIGKLR